MRAVVLVFLILLPFLAVPAGTQEDYTATRYAVAIEYRESGTRSFFLFKTKREAQRFRYEQLDDKYVRRVTDVGEVTINLPWRGE